ncbi:hypothetical protein TPB0596_34040 [Tsukamurella pulmonis]|uniref:EcsC protein family protein n=1 Tax=Tsukamurella pulmonis TaxID=47312 RepID=A0A1H1D2L1_9ACTN|nr:hypothetical protein [Tsukamurella pulmonis]KXO89644.1 hypothetical protein AXK56_05570 [Tsukamurella pulmonis]KXP10894.1 hypothetical protein AXK57_05805 [Tsukamurella pulmonis]SDQ70670.1 hypothetical protein SAMN04489765_1509 [Tsukamurella pulmonis]SUP22593.1 Uncharacterised protein [Tsukamurella pulmonis]BDD83641.1 hypothetical protein TPB0596_34040 [Tsukamurella pulmonis]
MANKPARTQPDQPNLPAVKHDGGGVIGAVIDRAARLQGPAVAKYVAGLRADHPDETPAQIIARLEKRYLLAVTGSGGAVGATAAVPGVGTVAALGAVGAETVVFMEASALYALAVAEVYGISVDDREMRKALVLTAVLGDAGLGALRATVGAKNASLLSLKKNPTQIPGLGNLNKQLMKMFTRRFMAKRAPLLLGKLLPAGIGLVVGAGGNRALGKGVIKNAREAFGPVPTTWPAAHLRVVDGATVDEPAPGLPGTATE